MASPKQSKPGPKFAEVAGILILNKLKPPKYPHITDIV